jgi:hypothetical protein
MPGTIEIRGADDELVHYFCEKHALEALGLRPNTWLRTFTDCLGRAVFGLLSLLCAIAFGGAVYLLFQVAQPQGFWKQVVWHALVDGFLLLSVFMLIVTAHFWSIGGKLTEILLKRLFVKGSLCVAAFVVFVMATVVIREVLKW